MKITSITQDDVTYVLSDEPVKTDGEKINYVYLVNGRIYSYMDCAVENKLEEMVRVKLLWHYPKEQKNEYPKLVHSLGG